jgi:hypothetical protein
MPVATNTPERAAMKQERERDAAAAMREYLAEQSATRDKTARLRALRLAREAEGVVDASPAKKEPSKAKGPSKAKVSKAKVSKAKVTTKTVEKRADVARRGPA